MTDHGGNLAATPATHWGPCPSSEALLAFCSGSLADGDLVTIADHLSQCETCDQAVRGLSSAGDGLSSRLRKALEQPQGVEEAALLRMQAAAKALVAGRQDSATAETSLDPESEAIVPARQAAIDRRSEAPATEMWLPPMPAKIGRYNIKSELGRGGFGSVYLAHDPDLDRLVAIKVPKFAAGVTDEKIKWFLEEARTAAQLKHPGIVAIYEVARSSDGSFYIVMEHVEGRSLSEELAKGKPSHERTVQIVAQAAAAIHYAHKKGFVHRDLKPGNILLDADGRVKIADFGLAVHEDQQRSRAGERAGTLAYMSPEQVRGDVHRLDGRTDVWSLGVILYELLTGRRPFAGTPWETADEVLHRPPKPPRQIDDAIPARLEQICLKCLTKDANGRYPSAGDVAEALTLSPGYLSSLRVRGVVAAVCVLGTAMAMAFALGIARGWLGSAGSVPARPVAKVEHPYQVEKVAKPFSWLPVLTQPPEVLFQPTTADEHWFYNPERQQVLMDTPAICLLGLGVVHDGGFKVQVALSKNVHEGSAGLFLGYRPLEPAGGKRRWACQTICVERQYNGQYAVSRTDVELVENTRKGFTPNKKMFAIAAVPPAKFDQSILEVVVKGDRISEVSWQGLPLEGFADPKLGEVRPCVGRFGLLNSRGSTTFAEARFMPLRSDHREP